MAKCKNCGPTKWNTCTRCGHTQWTPMIVGYVITGALIVGGVTGYCFLEDGLWRTVVGLVGVGLGGVMLTLGGLATATALAARRRPSDSDSQEARSKPERPTKTPEQAI